MRMLMNNLDEEVAERPRDLVVYGGTGKAARNWDCYHAIIAALKSLADDETLLVQSGKPVGIFKTHDYAPRVLIANSNLVGHWSSWQKFNELDRKSTRLNSSHLVISYAVFCLKKKNTLSSRVCIDRISNSSRAMPAAYTVSRCHTGS